VPQLTFLIWLLEYKLGYLALHSHTVLLVCVNEFQALLPKRLSLSLLVMSMPKLEDVVWLSDCKQTHPGCVPMCGLQFVFCRSRMTAYFAQAAW